MSANRRLKKLPLKSPSEWLDAGMSEIYRNMTLAGCTSFDGHSYAIMDHHDDKIRNLFAAYNANLARFTHGARGTREEMYEHAARYGMWNPDAYEAYMAGGSEESIRNGLLAPDHPTRDSHAPALPPADPVLVFHIPEYDPSQPRVELASLSHGHRLYMTRDEELRTDIAAKLGGTDFLSTREAIARGKDVSGVPYVFDLFWIENTNGDPVLSLFRYRETQVDVLVQADPDDKNHEWTGTTGWRRESRHWSALDIQPGGWTHEQYVRGYGLFPSSARGALQDVRGLFRQLGDEQSWLRLMIEFFPDYGFSEYDRALAMRSRNTAENFALHVLRGRWPEYEARIIGNPRFVESYARIVLLRLGSLVHWPEGEAEMIRAADPEAALEYALRIRRRRWEDAEPLFAVRGDIALRYAQEMLHGEFPAGEREIADGDIWASDYAELIRRRFLAGEAALRQSDWLWPRYVARFPDAQKAA